MSINREYYNKIGKNNNTPKKVLIFGLGLNGGGVGSAKFFSRQGTKVIVTDKKSKKDLAVSLMKLKNFPNIKYVLGRHRLTDFLISDLIIKNPAIPWSHPFLKKARKKGIKISTDTIIFFSRCPVPIIGVTGTKGKSTVAALLTKLLRKKYPKVWLLGNIRESFLEKLPQIKPRDLVVAELSSFQLEDLALIKKSPSIAVITNISPDHFDRYPSLKEYARAKANIFQYQKSTDHLIINGNDKFLVKLTKKTKAPLSGVKAKKHIIKNKNLSPLEINVALAIQAAKILGVLKKEITRTVKNFRGLPGRLEFIGKFPAKGGSASGGKNRIFINDTTATNPTAVLAGLQLLIKKYKRPIILIAGGQDKNLNYKTMAEIINKKIKILILLPGNATEKLKNSLKIKFKEAKNMKEAVATAYRLSESSDLIILSPGAASFNLFQNEFDRGKQFNQCVKNLS